MHAQNTPSMYWCPLQNVSDAVVFGCFGALVACFVVAFLMLALFSL
jgi:hypothetical protein